jgi:hypothetical protein
VTKIQSSAALLMPDAGLLSGLCAGVFASAALHPIDLVKVRMQVARGPSGGLLSEVRKVFRADGLKGFYRGVVPGLVGSGTSWGLYFFFYERIKARWAKEVQQEHLGTVAYMSSAVLSGATTVLFTNPIWLVKTRMQLQSGDAALKEGKIPYKGMVGEFLASGLCAQAERPCGRRCLSQRRERGGVLCAVPWTRSGTVAHFPRSGSVRCVRRAEAHAGPSGPGASVAPCHRGGVQSHGVCRDVSISSGQEQAPGSRLGLRGVPGLCQSDHQVSRGCARVGGASERVGAGMRGLVGSIEGLLPT